MVPSFPDGADPVSYMTPSRTASRGPSGCPPDFTGTDSFIMLSPATQEQQHLPDADSLCSAMCRPLPAPCPDGYMLRTPAQPYLRMKSEHAWPSPPLAPGDLDHFDQSHFHHDSPTSAASYMPNYTCSPATPGTWSPVSHVLAHPVKRFRSQPLPDQQGVSGVDMASPFTDCHRSYDTLPRMLHSLPMDPFDADSLSPEDLLVNTPSSTVTANAESPSDCLDDVPHMYPGASPPTHMDLQDPDAKLSEPYAKLIYRAFMSRPDRAMTLQDMYQWFRDNTTKAVSEKGGWQNSIRHNLSMNAAFTKRHLKEDGGVSSTEDSKRANEWVLEGWAIQHGVQSTTRYRKGGNSRRRPGARCAGQPSRQPTRHSAKRAMSGRKGGCAARDSRLRGRAFGQAMPMAPVPCFGLDRGLPSPPRSTIPTPYHSGSFSLQQFESMAPVSSAQHGLQDGTGQYDGPTAEPFGFMLGDGAATNMGHGAHGITEPRSVGAAPCGAQMSAYRAPAQSPFPCGIRDVHVGYDGEQQHGADACGAARLFESMSDGICDWAGGSM
ncbi:Forkhead box protein I1 [Tolypocladium capitatum]|uniref:Forkhead box protein I1 n=1 Tax=Tolypocladium capitatum TaxID=45235 RepID=A0A2K3Q9W6_9HYPO|nr:Forkhead box protein I1 [Tolypocladium capitatum]